MFFPRILSSRLVELAAAFPVVVVSGARQVGKSTLVRHVFDPTHGYVVFDPAIDMENARHDPDLFLDNHPGPMILDEIQYAPELVAAIKRRIDRERRPGRFVLTGSQQWGVLHAIAESLAGRAVFLDLEGFCLAEAGRQVGVTSWLAAWLEDPSRLLAAAPSRLKQEKPLYELLWRGWLPEARFLPLAVIPDFHAGYLRTYIERDVRLLAEVSDWQLFGRFVRLMAALTAQETNHSQLGRELGLTPKTAGRWLSLLKATFQWFEVPAYSGSTVKRVSAKPKGYLADTGMACAAQLLSSPSAIAGHPLWGALFETAVAGEIRKLSAVLSPRPGLYHWRSHGGAQVDMLLERDGVFYPIAVKAATHPSPQDTRGLAAFRRTYPGLTIAPGLVIAPVERIQRLSEHDHAIPWDLAFYQQS